MYYKDTKSATNYGYYIIRSWVAEMDCELRHAAVLDSSESSQNQQCFDELCSSLTLKKKRNLLSFCLQYDEVAEQRL